MLGEGESIERVKRKKGGEGGGMQMWGVAEKPQAAREHDVESHKCKREKEA